MGKISEALEKANQENTPNKPANGLPSTEETEVPDEKNRGTEMLRRESLSSTRQTIDTDAMPSSQPSSYHHSLVTLRDPESNEAEQFRLIKNNIFFPEEGTPPRCIMITSPSPSEGKSFVASNLSVSIAQSIDEYVLLMDCDLRAPTIHTIFGFKGKPGLSEHLTQARPLSSLMLKTDIAKLTILPAGTIPANPSELLSSEQMRRLIKEVSQRYTDRYIIIDAPPPYLTSEASALARRVDAIIVVVRHGKTRKKDLENIIQMYGRDKILGVVQNFVEKRPLYDYGYYKYGYGR